MNELLTVGRRQCKTDRSKLNKCTYEHTQVKINFKQLTDLPYNNIICVSYLLKIITAFCKNAELNINMQISFLLLYFFLETVYFGKVRIFSLKKKIFINNCRRKCC